jgi:hypothetical protein
MLYSPEPKPKGHPAVVHLLLFVIDRENKRGENLMSASQIGQLTIVMGHLEYPSVEYVPVP